MGWLKKLFGGDKSSETRTPPESARPSTPVVRPSTPAVGKCSKCGRAVFSPSMQEVNQLMMAGETDMIQAIATSCPTCDVLYCAGCAHRAGQKCPKCGTAVVEKRYR